MRPASFSLLPFSIFLCRHCSKLLLILSSAEQIRFSPNILPVVHLLLQTIVTSAPCAMFQCCINSWVLCTLPSITSLGVTGGSFVIMRHFRRSSGQYWANMEYHKKTGWDDDVCCCVGRFVYLQMLKSVLCSKYVLNKRISVGLLTRTKWYYSNVLIVWLFDKWIPLQSS
jgi:hypothetical protein